MDPQQFCLKWNNHQSNMVTVFDDLLINEDYVDVTLACEGHNVKAHKMVLSACSPFFQEVFKNNPCQHPIVVMTDMKYRDLKAIVKFMYKGEVNVSQDQLSALLKTAEGLQIKGLAEVANENATEHPAEADINKRRSEILENASEYRPPPPVHPSPPVKRRRRRPSNEVIRSSIEPLHHTMPSSNDNASSNQVNLMATQYQSNPSTSNNQSVIVSSEAQTSVISTPAFPDVKPKSEDFDEPEIIPIQLDHEISRVKSSPHSVAAQESPANDQSSFSMVDQNINEIDSGQGYPMSYAEARPFSNLHIPIKIKSKTGKAVQRMCKVCTKHGMKKTTSYQCRSCHVALHIDCFIPYH